MRAARRAGQNAASVASLLITTEAAIATKPEKKSGEATPGGEEDYGDDY